MKSNTSKEKSFYTQGQRFVSRVLFILWLLASSSPEGILAAPKGQPVMTPAATTSPGDPSLVSTPSTPLPGGILHLPPDSPGSFWGDSVASSSSTDAALQRPSNLLSRTIDKLAGRFWRPKPQKAPRTLAGPVAEGIIEGASASVQTPLQARIAQGDITSTEALVAAFNKAQTDDEQAVLEKWIRAYIEWLNKQPIGNLTMQQGAIVHEYSQLAHIQANSKASQQLLLDHFNSLCYQIDEKYNHSEETLLVALEHTLEALDSTIFGGNPHTLIRLGNKLLAKLEVSDNIFDQNTFPTHQSTLHALHHVLMLINTITPNQWNPQQADGPYQKYKDRVTDIYDKASYYPIRYHAQLLKQALRLLEEPEARVQAIARRAWHFIKGLVALYQGIPLSEIPGIGGDPKIDLEALQKGLENMHQAFKRKQDEHWYLWFIELTQKCLPLLCSSQASGEEYTEFEALYAHYLHEDQQKQLQEEGRKAFLYSLVMQLGKLSMQALSESVRDCSTAHLVSLAQSSDCQRYAEIFEALLDSLARVAVHGQGRSKETAKTGLTRLVTISSDPNSMTSYVLRFRKRDRQGTSAVAKYIEGWLGSHASLVSKLSSIPSPCAVPELGELFKVICQELQEQPVLQVDFTPVLKRFDDWQKQPAIRGNRQLSEQISALSDQISQLQVSSPQDGHQQSLAGTPAFRDLLSKIDALLQEPSQVASHLASLHAQLNQLQGAIQAIHDQRAVAAPLIIDPEQALKAYYQERFSEVPSFFPEEPKTPMGQIQCYLMLLEQVKVKEVPPEGQENQLMAIHERIEWQKRPIALQDLFKKRSIKPDGPIEEISKVLLIGEAGTGKTTLSRKIAHDWARGAWGDDFTAVYLLPVCALQQDQYNGATPQSVPTLVTAIVRECFPAEYWKRNEDFERLRTQVQKELKHPTALVILDGMDEQKGAFEQILEQAQRGSHKLLMLSRPYGIDKERQMIELEIEHLGLNNEHIGAYVQRYFQKRGNPTRSAELLRFIKAHPAPAAVAHVPANLEWLCALWYRDPEGVCEATMQGSLSGFYCELTGYMWNRYKVHPSIGSATQKELFKKLGAIALDSLAQSTVQLSCEQVRDILAENAISEAMLRASGFLQVVGQDQYKFPHLTFQEYFAGRTLAEQFLSRDQDEQEHVRKFLAKHKYEGQHAKTLSFMAGEVSRARGVAGIQALLRHMESDKEIMDLQHLLLQLRVIHEWLSMATEQEVGRGMAELEREFRVMASLQRWFQKGLEHVRSPNRRHNNEGEKLLNLLTEKASWAVANHAPKLFHLLLNAAKDRNEDENVREAARKAFVKVLKATPRKAPATIPGLIEAAKDQHWDVRETAIEALEQVAQAAPNKVSDIIEILKQAAGDHDKNTRQAAIKAIGKVTQVAPEQAPGIISTLQNAAKNTDANVREAAIEALGKAAHAAPEQAPGIIPTLKDAAKDSQWHVQRAALEALAQVALKAAPSETKITIDTLCQAAQEDDVDAQQAALAQMAKISGKVPEVIQRLLKFAQERGCDVQLPALKALAQVPEISEQALDIISILKNKAKDKEANVRQAAIEALTQIALAAPSHVPDMIQTIQNAAQDQDCDVRQATIEALAQIALTASSHVPDMIQTILQAAKDEEAYVRLPAIEALGKVAHAALEQAPGIISTLEDAAKDQNCDVQHAAINTLIQVAYGAPPLEATKIINTLCQFAQDKNYNARELAIEALGRVALAVTKQTPDTIPTLHQVAQDEDANVREAALEALGKVAHATSSQSPAIIQTLLQAAKGEDANVRQTAIEALAQVALADTSQVSDIIEILKDAAQAESADVRLSALKALEEVARVATSKAQDDIIEILEDAAISSQELNQEQLLYHVLDHCRAAAIEALPQVALANNDKALKVITILKNTIEDGDICDSNPIPPAVVVHKATLKALAQATLAVKEEAPKIISILQKAAKDEDANVCKAAIEALPQVAIAATDEAPDIIEILKDAAYSSANQDPDIIRAAIAALEKVAHGVPSQAPTIIPILIATARDQYTCKDARDAAIDALEKTSLLIVLQRYLVIQDPRLIPYIAPRLYHTPLVIQKPMQNQQQVVTLYATAGQPSQCSQPQEAVQHFMCLIKPEAGQAKKDLKYHMQYLEMLQARLQSLGLDNNHPDVAASLNNVGGAYYVLDNNNRALEYANRALTMRRRLYGASTNHPSIADSLANMGLVHHALGEHQQALRYGEGALTMRRGLYRASAHHPSLADSLTNVGTAYQSLDKHDEALKCYRQAFEMQQVLCGDSHPRVADSLVRLGTGHVLFLGQPQQALQFYERALTIFKPNLSLQEEEIDQ